ncbi:FAD/NAD(P)-binding-like protein [Alternaria alternata]|nr:FAD/NAD(P)-binding-like protein [Alternaria alternata]
MVSGANTCGGSSGTHAAVSLKDAGKSLVVIEVKGRLGGHTETYTDPVTGRAQDYGVLVFHNESTVLDYFARFDIPLAIPEFATNRANYDLSTGLEHEPRHWGHPQHASIGAGACQWIGSSSATRCHRSHLYSSTQ